MSPLLQDVMIQHRNSLILICVYVKYYRLSRFESWISTPNSSCGFSTPSLLMKIHRNLNHVRKIFYKEDAKNSITWVLVLDTHSITFKSTLKTYKGCWKKNSPVVTFSVTVGLIIIAQQCYTPCWKALDVSFRVITEPFLCKRYFLR